MKVYDYWISICLIYFSLVIIAFWLKNISERLRKLEAERDK